MKRRAKRMPLILWLWLATPGFADPSALSRARELYSQTAYEEALKVVENASPLGAPEYALAGKCRFHLEDFKGAVAALEKAVAAEPGNSEYYHWLGKAWGRRAERSSFLMAPRYAARARDAFLKAVDLDPRNLEAVSDLFEYYLEAPGFLGGGLDKAARLAETIRAVDPAEYHFLQARLALKRKDPRAAEEHYRSAVKLSPGRVGPLLDLAGFLARHGKFAESEAIFREAAARAPDDPKVLFARASAYLDAGRNQAEAKRLLEQYLESKLTPEHPSRSEARRLLRKARETG